MSPGRAEAITEYVRSKVGKAKDVVLNTLKGLFDAVKGSDSIKEEIGKQINTAIDTPVEAGRSTLTAGSELVHAHPIEATKEAADGFIETSKNVGKLTVAPLSGTLTVVRSGIRTGWKVLKAPFTKTFAAFESAQRTNEKLFSLTDKFKEWNKLKPAEEAPVETASPEIADAEKPKEKKVPALMQVPGSETKTTPEPIPTAETETDEKKTDMPIAA